MKTLRLMALLAGVLALSACTKVVPVQQNEVAFEIKGASVPLSW